MFKKTFRGEIFFYYIIVFIIFTIAVIAFQYQREKKYRISQLENTLDNISEITYRFIENNNLIEQKQVERLQEITGIIPQTNTRITVIDKSGRVLYDSFVNEYEAMENHLRRPEIQKSIAHKIGSNIRRSATTKQEFYYYAKSYPNYFVRTAVIYNVEVRNLLKANSKFIFFIVGLFAIIGIVLVLVTFRLSIAITRLKDFAVKAGRSEQIEYETPFPDNELGTISSQIIQIYNNLTKAKDDLSQEREKLFSHLNALNEGIAFFNSDKEHTLSNSHFIQSINVISNKSTSLPNDIFKSSKFQQLNNFLKDFLSSEKNIDAENLPQYSYTVFNNERYFKIQSIIFGDRSFEVLITDITRLEKRRLLKQQLTSNIAHELKTPLSSIKGYLETILDNWPLPDEKHKYFINKAYSQSERLTDLINDVSLLNNIEDAGELFRFKMTSVKKVIDEVYENLANRIHEKNIEFIVEAQGNIRIRGNDSLLFSIFQNFVENSINYGGKGIKIVISVYHEDEKYYYFSYYDSGAGIPNKHLPRIFERFYRVNNGRTRDTGGTGLGLAIVKNAVQLHGGEISVRNKPKKGTEFLFSLSKK